jgi:localization factor PodJL
VAVDTADSSKQPKTHAQEGNRDESATPAQAGSGERPTEPGRSVRKKAVMPAPLEAIMRDVVPDAATAPTGTMARLERRVYVLERAFADIVERHEKSIRERTSSVTAVEESLGALSRRFDEVHTEHEGRFAALNESFAESMMRVNALEENAAQSASPFHPAVAQAAPPPSDAPAQAAHAEEVGFEATPVAADGDPDLQVEPVMAPDSPPVENETYLTAARRAAMAAQTEQHQMVVRDKAPSRRMGRVKLMVLGSAAPAAVVVAGILALNRHTVTARPVLPPAAKIAATLQPLAMPTPVTAEAALALPQVVAAQPSDPTPAQTAASGSLDALVAHAADGDTQAQRDLGLKYLAGDGVAPDEAAAAGWLMRAAYAGDGDAQYWLGTLYARGHGLPADAFQASHWYEAAARQGNARAMHSLAVAHFEGWGMAKDPAEAARWFARAAALGVVDSQYDLAVLYERGAGVEASRSEAYKWYAIAARSGDKESKARLAVLARQMNPTELARAQQQAAAFKPATTDETSDAAKGAPKSGG